MRIFIMSALLGLSLFCHTVSRAQGINFQKLSLKEAMSKASDPTNPKLILVDCFTTWCIPCIEMAEVEFPKKISGDYFNPKFIPVTFDMEKGEGKELAKKYNVTAYPTFLILNSQGDEINRVVGKSTAEEFIDKVKLALDPTKSLAGLKAAYEKSKDMMTGLAYAEALYQNSKDHTFVLNELFENGQEFERFGQPFLHLALGTVKFGSPFFRKLLMEKARIDLKLGTEVTNKIIFDRVRKDMYSIANENGAKYNVFYTPKEVEEVAYTIGLLKLPSQEPENHMCNIALYVVNKDLDGLIRYYKRYIWSLPPNTVFKGILDDLLRSKIAKAEPAQKLAIKAYFESTAKTLERQANGYRASSEAIK